MDGAPREGALAEVLHVSDGGLELAVVLLEAGHHHVHVAVQNHADTNGLPAHRQLLDHSAHKVLGPPEVSGSDALGAVNHKDQFQTSTSALETTAWKTEADK